MTDQAVEGAAEVALLTVPEGTSAEDIRAHIAQLEATMLGLEQAPAPVQHTFGHQTYVRTITFAKGLMATGAIHRYETVHWVHVGRMTILTENGGTRVVEGPAMFVSPPLAKMAGYAHEDTVWSTCDGNPDNLRDIAQLEARLIISDAELALVRSANPDHRSFAALLSDMGVSLEQVNASVRDTSDHIDMPDHTDWNIQFGASAIEGQGAFTVRDAQMGDLLAPMRRAGCRTSVGRLTNHSAAPNAFAAVLVGSDNVDLLALYSIPADTEITVDYRQVMQARGLAPAMQVTR